MCNSILGLAGSLRYAFVILPLLLAFQQVSSPTLALFMFPISRRTFASTFLMHPSAIWRFARPMLSQLKETVMAPRILVSRTAQERSVFLAPPHLAPAPNLASTDSHKPGTTPQAASPLQSALSTPTVSVLDTSAAGPVPVHGSGSEQSSSSAAAAANLDQAGPKSRGAAGWKAIKAHQAATSKDLAGMVMAITPKNKLARHTSMRGAEPGAPTLTANLRAKAPRKSSTAFPVDMSVLEVGGVCALSGENSFAG